jgi:hypothetical protein
MAFVPYKPEGRPSVERSMIQSSQHSPIPAEILQATLDLWKKGGNEHTIPVVGTSMLPLLQPGDRLVVSHALSSLRRGDILVFLQGDQLIAHRLLCIYRFEDAGLTLLTKGDCVAQPDPPLAAAQVLGVVVAVCRNGQHKRLGTRWWRWSSWVASSLILLKMRLSGRYRSPSGKCP